MNTEKTIKRDKKTRYLRVGRSPIVLERGSGMTVWDADGRAYLDFTSGIGVNSLGFADPDWAAAVAAQAGQLQHTSNLYYTGPCAKLARKLCKRTGLDKVFFANSGAEANEGAIKCARKYSADAYGAGRSKVLSLVNSFHGRTLATLTATGQEVFHHDFGPFPADFGYLPAGDIDALEAALDEGGVCAVMMELVQGEGGVIALDPDYVHRVAGLCAEKDVLLIVDEVQTGVGRTGTFLACQHYGITPDIVTLAKGLGGGLPIGAVLMKQKVAKCMGPGSHGSTFGGNPVACAGACVVVDRMDDAFLDNVNACAARLRQQLAELPEVAEVSGLGLMVGIALKDGRKAAEVRTRCEHNGLLVLTAKDRVRLLPPLILTPGDVDRAVQILAETLAEIPPEEPETPAEPAAPDVPAPETAPADAPNA